MSKIINVIVDVEGEIKIDTEGFTGKSCVIESQFIKDVLGEEIHQELKPVYFSEAKAKVAKRKYLNICG